MRIKVILNISLITLVISCNQLNHSIESKDLYGFWRVIEITTPDTIAYLPEREMYNSYYHFMENQTFTSVVLGPEWKGTWSFESKELIIEKDQLGTIRLIMDIQNRDTIRIKTTNDDIRIEHLIVKSKMKINNNR